MYALVDCNNFYASCEKLFRPDLKHTSVVVLSNNDGCVVARSREAKALGIKMGVPYFQIKETIDRNGVAVFSSNYELYADISRRVMETLESLSPAIEIYSIDEAFIDLKGMERHIGLARFGQEIQSTVLAHTGISVGVGIAPTKTLAKLANHAAKTYRQTGGVVVLTDPVRQEKLMKLTEVGEVWGVGRRLTRQLHELGIQTVWELVQYDTPSLRKHFSVVLERTQRELTGIACFGLDETPVTKQQILCSRSFGERIERLDHLKQAISTYTANACERLRQEGMTAKSFTVFCRSSPFADQMPYYSNQQRYSLPYPSDHTPDFLALASQLTEQLFKPGIRFAKAGVMLSDFYAPGTFQLSLFDEPPKAQSSQRALQACLDQLNRQQKGLVFFASEGIDKPWTMKRNKVSPRYTTRWHELPVVT